MNNTPTVTSAEEVQRILEEKRYSYFTLPTLGVTIKYRKPDLLKLSFNNSLPSMISENVIAAYKARIDGAGDEYAATIKDKKLTADNEFLQSLREKGYTLLKELGVSYKFLDVPQSDLGNGVWAWVDIPEEDAIAFVVALISGGQAVETVQGGEVSAEDITTFPDGRRVGKRSAAR